MSGKDKSIKDKAMAARMKGRKVGGVWLERPITRGAHTSKNSPHSLGTSATLGAIEVRERKAIKAGSRPPGGWAGE